jgi:hypothetical protein
VIALIRREGQTFQQIADALGLTRGAVAGIVRRFPNARKSQTKQEKAKPMNDTTTEEVAADTSSTPNVEPTLVWSALEIIHLPPNGCKYPVAQDDFGTHLFCSDPAVGGKPYCAVHVALCNSPVRAPSSRPLVLPRLR